MVNKKFYFLICALFITLLLIGAVSASEDTNDNITAVSDDNIVVDEVVSEVESNDDSISVNADEQKGDVDDSASTLKANQENISVEDESAPTLGNNNDDVVLSDANDGMNHVYVSPDGTGDGSSYESPTSIANAITANIASNTVIHLADGGYSLTKAVTIQKKDNLIIQAENPKNATITSTVALTFTGCKNILIKGITFITSKQLIATRAASGVNTENFTIDDCSFEIGDKSAIILNMNVGANLNINNCYFTASLTNQYPININPAVPANINIYNCTFENITMAGLTMGAIYFSPSSSFTGSICIDSCKFYKIQVTLILIWKYLLKIIL